MTEKYVPTLDDIAKDALKARTNVLTDDGKYSNARRNVLEKEWTEEIRSNVITELPFTVPDNILQKLRDLAFVADYKSYYELNLCDIQQGDARDWITQTFSPFEEIQTFAFLKLAKNSYIMPHADPNRYVNIYIPLYPLGDDYTPLEIYYNNKIYGIPYNTNKVYAWNTRILHGVMNKGAYERYNLQMSIYYPYSEWYEKYKEIINV